MTDNHLKLTICVITYNHEAFIKTTLDSILSQDLPDNLEIIIADDKSIDKTREIIDSYANINSHIVRIYQEKNIGPAKNFKDLIEAAKGEYVSYLDGDDIMLPGKIKFQIEYLDNNPDCNIVAHNMIVLDHDNQKEIGKFSNKKSGLYDVGDLARYGTFFANSSKMFRRSCNKGYPYYEEGFKYVGDYIWHIYHVKEKKIGYTDVTYGTYRKHSQSASFRNNGIERLRTAHQENIKAILLTKSYDASESDINYGLMREYYAYALSSLLLNEYDEYQKSVRASVQNLQFYSLKHFAVYLLSFFSVGIIKKASFLFK